MGQLTGEVADDFNNLFTPSSAASTRSSAAGEERAHAAAGGRGPASRGAAKTLVQRLPDFARRQPLRPVKVDLGSLLDGMADLVASTVRPRIRMKARIEPGLPCVLADADQLKMAILNLAVNARDSMAHGGHLRIEAGVSERRPATLPRDGRFEWLAVVDSGTGMDDATLACAVEPFFSTKGAGRGTGLGLSVVHGLTCQLAGALELRSRPGEGTTVELWLPITDAPVPETPERGIALPKAFAARAPLVGMRTWCEPPQRRCWPIPATSRPRSSRQRGPCDFFPRDPLPISSSRVTSCQE